MTTSTTRISISTSREDQTRAAQILSGHLNDLGYGHAYIGGFAWSLLGSSRPTEDIDVMIQTEGDDAIPDLRQTLSELNEKFTTAGIKFYYVQEPGQPGLSGSELVKASKNNILIETLKAGRIGLPIVAEPIYLVQHESGVSIQILHPSVLILTKLKRWFHSHSSTRPKTILKVKSDQRDIDYMIYWLAQEGMRIRFDLYEGKSRQELLIFVETYKKKFEENETLMATLRSILEPEDWNEICAEDSELEESVNLAQAVDDEQQARVALTVADVDVPHI